MCICPQRRAPLRLTFQEILVGQSAIIIVPATVPSGSGFRRKDEGGESLRCKKCRHEITLDPVRRVVRHVSRRGIKSVCCLETGCMCTEPEAENLIGEYEK